jgi:hypothetical protein
VVYVLDSLAEKYGLRKQLRLDNGPEFRSKELLDWAKAKELNSPSRNRVSLSKMGL